MSLASSLLTPLPGQTVVEVIDGTAKRRITRRFEVTQELIENSARLLEAVEAYGTADGAFGGAAKNKRTPGAPEIFPAAFLVELRLVPDADKPEKRIAEKVYEETPYTKDDATQTDAQGAIVSVDKTVVCAVGQSLPAAAAGYSRVVLGSSRDFGRLVYRVRDVRGEGVVSKGFSEDGQGVIMEDGSFTTMTAPTDPAPGAFESWKSVAQGGYWLVTYSKAATAQLPAPGRQRREKSAGNDGSMTQSVTESGADPACAHDFGTAQPVLLVGESNFMRQGGIVGRTRRWLRLPPPRNKPAVIPWTKPGVVGFSGGNITQNPPINTRYAGVVALTWETTPTAVTPWQPVEWAYGVWGGKDAEGNSFSHTQAFEGYLADASISITGGGTFCGMDVTTAAGTILSNPTTRPSGATVVDCDITEYAAGLDGTLYYQKAVATITLP